MCAVYGLCGYSILNTVQNIKITDKTKLLFHILISHAAAKQASLHPAVAMSSRPSNNGNIIVLERRSRLLRRSTANRRTFVCSLNRCGVLWTVLFQSIALVKNGSSTWQSSCSRRGYLPSFVCRHVWLPGLYIRSWCTLMSCDAFFDSFTYSCADSQYNDWQTWLQRQHYPHFSLS